MIFIDPEPKPEETSAEEQTDFADAFASRTTGEDTENTGEEGGASQDDTKPADAAPASEAAAPAAAQNGSDDPFAGMTPEQKSYWETVLHSERSNRGRVAALTKKVQAVPAQTAPAATTETGSDEQQGSDQAADLEAKLKTAAEEYPDAVGPLVEVIADIRKSIAGLNQSVAPIVEDQDSAAMAKAYADLEKAHPDYRAVAVDPNWHAWIADQPEKVQQLAESYDPREVSLTIALFKTERQAAMSQEQDTTVPNATEEKRKRQLDGGRDVSSKSMPAAAGVPDDFGAAFNARAKSAGA